MMPCELMLRYGFMRLKAFVLFFYSLFTTFR